MGCAVGEGERAGARVGHPIVLDKLLAYVHECSGRLGHMAEGRTGYQGERVIGNGDRAVALF